MEPEAYLRAKAEAAAERALVDVRVVPGTADALPADDESFDVAVASLVLCSVPDQAHALAEIRRVLRPGGELRFYEHIRSHHPKFARRQRRVDIIWPRVGGGCHASRATDEAIEQVLFASLHMSLLGIVAGHPVFRWLNLRPISTASCIP